MSADTASRSAIPGNVTSACTTYDSVGQNSGLPAHRVPARSTQPALKISHEAPADLTVDGHFGHRVCMPIIMPLDEIPCSPPAGARTVGSTSLGSSPKTKSPVFAPRLPSAILHWAGYLPDIP